jgi:hypothetical protein
LKQKFGMNQDKTGLVTYDDRLLDNRSHTGVEE